MLSNRKRSADMLTALQITSRLHVTPLLDIRDSIFGKLYSDGLQQSLFKEHTSSPITDHYVFENLRLSLAEADANEQHDRWLSLIGFHFGRLHGAILSP